MTTNELHDYLAGFLEGYAKRLNAIERDPDAGDAAHKYVEQCDGVAFTVDGGVPWLLAGTLEVESIRLTPSHFEAPSVQLLATPGNNTVTVRAFYGKETRELNLELPALAGELEALALAWRYEDKGDA